ncbi:unnamed protein product [Diamesa hyperborea]
MNSLQVIFTLGFIVIVSSLPIEFTHENGDLKLTINDIFAEINDVLKRDLNEQLHKDAIDFGDKVNTTTSDGGNLQVQVQHFNSANGFPVFFNQNDDHILDDKKVSQIVEKVDEHVTHSDVVKSTESVPTTTASTTTTTLSSTKVSDAPKSTESVSTTSAPTTSLGTVSTSSVAPKITIVLPEKVSGDSSTKAPIVIRSIEQTVTTTSAIPSTTRLSSSAAGTISTSSVAPALTVSTSSVTPAITVSTSSVAPAITTTSQAKSSELSTESVSTTVASSSTTHAPETTTSGNIFLEAFDSIASFFQSKPESPVTTTQAPTTTVAATTSSGSVSNSTKQSDVAEVPTTPDSPIVHIVELKKDIAAVPVIFTQV